MVLQKIKTLFLYIFNLILWLIAKIVPKDENIWIFGAWFAEKYADNSNVTLFKSLCFVRNIFFANVSTLEYWRLSSISH